MANCTVTRSALIGSWKAAIDMMLPTSLLAEVPANAVSKIFVVAKRMTDAEKASLDSAAGAVSHAHSRCLMRNVAFEDMYILSGVRAEDENARGNGH